MKDILKLLLMLIILTVATSLTISSCGNLGEINGIDEIVDDGDDDDDDDDDDDLAFVTGGGAVAGGGAGAAGLLQGVFLDSAVEGISYTGGGASGTTNSSGIFNYTAGSKVTFSIGGITLGTATGKATVTPIDVAGATDESDQRVINMIRLLQTLDDDGNPDNGIKITSTTRNAAKNITSVDFNQSPSGFTGSTATDVATLTATTSAGTSTLVSTTEALTHFQSTLTANNISTVTVATTSAITYDDFSTGTVSTSLWTIAQSSGSSYSVVDGVLAVTTGSPASQISFAVINDSLSTSINAFQADLNITAGTSDDNTTYLKGIPYVSSSGDINTKLTLKGDGSASYSISAGATDIASGSFSSKTTGSSHEVGIGFDRTNGILYFQIDTEKLFHIMDTSTYPISTSVWKNATIFAEAESGASIATAGKIDNVQLAGLTDLFSTISHVGGSIQGQNLSTTASSVTTLAGDAGDSGDDNGTGDDAEFNNPTGITTDGSNLYVTDGSNHTIRKVTPFGGVVTTFAGDSGDSGSTNGTGTDAEFNNPTGITTDGINLYVSDSSNNMIRKIVISSQEVTTLAGNTSSGSADGTGTAASFNGPTDLTIVGDHLYVADTFNHTIRKINISTQEVTTLAGGAGNSGSSNGTGTAASFNKPTGITTNGSNLYVVDSGNDLIRQVVISSAVVDTLAGSGSSGSTDATGTSASFNNPTGITTDGTNLFVTDTFNHLIRKVVISSGVVSTLSGSGSSGSANGSGTSATFYQPIGITTDGTHLFVADTFNHLVRKIK